MTRVSRCRNRCQGYKSSHVVQTNSKEKEMFDAVGLAFVAIAIYAVFRSMPAIHPHVVFTSYKIAARQSWLHRRTQFCNGLATFAGELEKKQLCLLPTKVPTPCSWYVVSGETFSSSCLRSAHLSCTRIPLDHRYE